MKKIVQNYIKQFDAYSEYEGKTRTLHVFGANAANAILEVIKAFPMLPFKLK